MDVEYLSSSSSTEAQMDLMAIMTEMEKFNQVSEKAPLVHHQPSQPFSNGSRAAAETPHPYALVANHQPPSLAFVSGQSREHHRHHHLVASPMHINSPAGRVVLESWHSGGSGGGGGDASLGGGCGLPSVAAMREMIFHIAALQPIHIDPESVKPPKRRNVNISKDPQSVAARHRRERISERIRILQQLVPGGTKMDTASMLDEAIHYMKFLKTQVQNLELAAAANRRTTAAGFSNAVSGGVGFLDGSYLCYDKANNNCEAWDQGFAMNSAATSSSDGELS